MSYILEALKKAEQQRELGRVPGIASEHDARSAGPRKYWLWLLALVLAVNVVVLLVLLWPDRRAEPPAEAAAKAPALSQPTRVVPTHPLPEVVIQEPEALRPVPLPPPVAEIQAPGPASRDATVNEAAAGASGGPISRPPVKVESPVLPVWPQIPGHVFEQLNGSLHLDVHVYSDEPQSRFVLINLRKYHEGDDLQEGPALEEITREGVILSFRGQRFQVRRQ